MRIWLILICLIFFISGVEAQSVYPPGKQQRDEFRDPPMSRADWRDHFSTSRSATTMFPTDHSRDMNMIAHIGEYVEDVRIRDGYAYCATGYGFAIFDVSVPEETHKTSQIQFNGYASNLRIHENYAYVVAEGSGLRIIDVSDPYNPGEAALFPGNPTAIALNWPYAFIGDNFWGVQILDVSDLDNIHEVGRYDYNWGFWDFVWIIELDGDFMYVSDWKTGVRIVNISEPTNPIHVDHILQTDVFEIELTDSLAFFGGRGFSIYDKTNPAELTQLYTDSDLYIQNMRPVDNQVYAVGQSNFWIWDVTNPDAPVETVNHLLGWHGMGFINNLIVENDRAYIASGSGGFVIYDIANVYNSLDLLYRTDLPALPYDIQIQENYAFVADYANGVVALDISQPDTPQFVSNGQTNIYAGALSVSLSNNYAYLAGWRTGFWIFDIGDPTSIVQTGFYNDTPHQQFVTSVVRNQYAYVVDEYDGLHILDVSNPYDPNRVGHFQADGQSIQYGDLDIMSNYALLLENHSGDSTGIRVLDIEDPANPLNRGFYRINHSTNKITIHDHFAYISGRSSIAFTIHDVSDPEHILFVNEFPASNALTWVNKITFEGNIAYAPSRYGLTILDASDPVNLVPLDSMIYAESSRIAVRDGYILAPTQKQGLSILSSDVLAIEDAKNVNERYAKVVLQNYPNPFNTNTMITFSLNQPSHIVISVYNVSGQFVKAITNNRFYPTGTHHIAWDGTDSHHRKLSNGIYLIKLETNERHYFKQLLLLRN